MTQQAQNPQLTSQPQLLIKEIKDIFLRTNFQNLQTYFQQNNQLLGFNFFEAVFTKAQSNLLIAHGLKTVPLDIITTQVTGAGQVTFNYGLFDSSNINISSTGAARVRFFAGTYYNQQSSQNANKTDVWTINGSTISSASFYTGSGVPANATGNDNDGYMDVATGHIYTRTGGAWSIIRRAGSATSFSKQSYTTNFAGNFCGPSQLDFALDEQLHPLQVTIVTKGGEVDVGFMPNTAIMANFINSPTGANSGINTDQSPTDSGIFLVFYRDGVPVATHLMYMQNNVSIEIHSIPASAFWFTDTNVPAGQHIYTCKGQLTNNARSINNIANSVMFARERAT